MPVNSILSFQQLQQLAVPSTSSDTQSGEHPSGLFGKLLKDAMNQVVNQQNETENLIEGHMLGKPITDIEALTAIKQADLTLKTMVQVRNKVVEAYKELKQIQV